MFSYFQNSLPKLKKSCFFLLRNYFGKEGTSNSKLPLAHHYVTFELWGAICPLLSILAFGSIVNNALTFKIYHYLEFEMKEVDYSLAIYPLYGSVFFSQILMALFLYPEKQSGIPSIVFIVYLISVPLCWFIFSIFSYWDHEYVKYIRIQANFCCCKRSRLVSSENERGVPLLRYSESST